MAANTRNLIFSIYAHLLLAIGVVIVAVGTYMLLSNLTGRFLMDKYPLGYEETRCDYLTTSPMSYPDMSSLSPEEREAERARIQTEDQRNKDNCLQELETFRARREQGDFVNAINTLVVGLLVLAPHAWMVARLNRKN